MLNEMPPKLLLLLAILILSPQVISAQNCNSNSRAAKAVSNVAEGIIAADNARDLKRVMNFYALDAVLMPPNDSPVTGHDAIRPRYELMFSSFQPKIEARVDQICVEGRTSFVRGHNGGQLVSTNGGESRQLDDTYLMLLRKGNDGLWRITHLIWHRSH